MTRRTRRRVYLGLVVAAVALFGFGILAGYVSRNDTICPNGKAPIAQDSEPIGPTLYMCSDGKVVTK